MGWDEKQRQENSNDTEEEGGCFVEFHNGGYIGDWEPPLFLFAILKSGSLLRVF